MSESEMPTLRLSAEAMSRLRIETTLVRKERLQQTRLVGGEVIVPPGRALAVAAPVAGVVSFTSSVPVQPGAPVQRGAVLMQFIATAPSDRDTRARVEREVAAAEASLKVLEQRVKRNQSLIDQGAGSARIVEEAIAARDIAIADLETARARERTLSKDPLISDVAMAIRAPATGVVRLLSVADGQAVAAGASLVEIAGIDTLQVRIPVYSGDLGRLELRTSARVRHIGEHQGVAAEFVLGPPTAEPDRGTVDRYVVLPPDAGFALGERVLVEIPLRDHADSLVVPTSAIVLDAWGGAWVYQSDKEQFKRVRVNPVRRVAQEMVLSHGPAAGSRIVSVGAAELFGEEFPPGH